MRAHWKRFCLEYLRAHGLELCCAASPICLQECVEPMKMAARPWCLQECVEPMKVAARPWSGGPLQPMYVEASFEEPRSCRPPPGFEPLPSGPIGESRPFAHRPPKAAPRPPKAARAISAPPGILFSPSSNGGKGIQNRLTRPSAHLRLHILSLHPDQSLSSRTLTAHAHHAIHRAH